MKQEIEIARGDPECEHEWDVLPADEKSIILKDAIVLFHRCRKCGAEEAIRW